MTEIPSLLAGKIAAYNDPSAFTAAYNHEYNDYILARTAGTAAAGSLAAWMSKGGAAHSVKKLLRSFGLDSRKSELAPLSRFKTIVAGINPASVNWISGISLPLAVPPPDLVNPATGTTLAGEIAEIYCTLSAPGAVTVSGGYVAASKAMHCLFPVLAPMVDGTHSGISYFNIVEETYRPPLGIVEWTRWLGARIDGVPKRSPRGGGRYSLGWKEFMAAIGINQHIYELWQAANGYPGLAAFLALDPTPGTTGIPRIVDKCLW